MRPPAVGFLWTPGYWGWGGSAFIFHAGYWGPRVGFYGGIHYGFGYAGIGYAGGHWAHGNFFYNRAVSNFGGTRITNVFNRKVVINRTTDISYNGGRGGVTARPNAAEHAAARERRAAPTDEQVRQRQAAAREPALRASENHGRPSLGATRGARELNGHGAAAAGKTAARERARSQQHSARSERAVQEHHAERAAHERAPHAARQHEALARAAHRPAAQRRA